MNETLVTVQGYVGTEPEERAVGDTVVASFRIGSTPRRFNREQNSWVDQETNWYTVNAWRTLGKHVLASVRMREPVIVHGRLRTNVWKDDEGRTNTTLVIEALSVGHDLGRGTTVFLKATPSATGGGVDDADLRALNAALGAGGPQMTSDGEVLESEPAA